MDMSKKYGVKKAVSLSDDSVLYSSTKLSAPVLIVGTVLLIAASVFGTIYAYTVL